VFRSASRALSETAGYSISAIQKQLARPSVVDISTLVIWRL
jgi:hypothetical protein